MAWAVQTDGVNDRLESATAWVPTDLDNWSVEIEAKRLSGTANEVLFTDSDYDDGIYFNANTGGAGDNLSVYVAGNNVNSSLSGFNTDLQFHIIRVDCVAGTFELKVDGISYGTNTRGNLTFARNRCWFACRAGTSSFMNQQTKYVSLIDPSTPSNSRYYDATASSHAAGTPVLTDTIGGNNATGVNMATDGSVWINLGGGGVTITPNTINSVSTANNPVVAFKSAVNLTPNSIDSSSAALNPTVVFESVLNVSPSSVNSVSTSKDPEIAFSSVLNILPISIDSASNSNDPAILFSSVLNIAPNVVDSESSSLNPIVSFSSALNINPNSIDSQSLTLDPSVEFKSIINVTPLTIDSLSIALSPNITSGQIQTIGEVKAGFKEIGISVEYTDNSMSVSYKPNAITVNFK